jgi:hypothetical protein
MFVLLNKVLPGDVLPGGDECTPVEDNPVLALAHRLASAEAVEGVLLGSVGDAREPALAVLRR